MNKVKQCFFMLFFALLAFCHKIQSSNTEEQISGKEPYSSNPNKALIEKTDSSKKNITQEFGNVNTFTTEEIGQYLNNKFDNIAKKIKPSCPIPYNTIIDAKNSFLFGGPLGLGIYVTSKAMICGLKKTGIFKKTEVKTIKKKYKKIHTQGFDVISGGYRTKAEIKNISFSQKTAREHLATGLFWFLKRLSVATAVLGTTWLLHKYALSQSMKDKLAWYDYKITDPLFRIIAKCNIWRFAYNPITH